MSDENRVMIIDLGEGLRQSIETTAGLDTGSAEMSDVGSVDDILYLIGSAKPSIVFFGVSGRDSDVLEIIELVAATYPKVGLVVTSAIDDSEVILRALRVGADEFLAQNCEPAAFSDAIQRVCKKKGILRPKAQSGPGQTIATFSGKGGCGTTVIAANLAFNLARLSRSKVGVLDFDLQFGDMATMMDIQAKHTLADVIAQDGTVDDDLLSQVMTEHSSGVWVMPSPTDPADSEALTADHITAIVQKLREEYAYLIIDTSCGFGACTLAALDAADRILLMTDTLVPSIQAAQRCIKVFDKLEYDREKILLVVNRFDSRAEITEGDLASAFDVPVFDILPNDFAAATTAIDTGAPLAEVAEKSALTSAVKALAARFVEGAEKEGPQEPSAGFIDQLRHMMSKK